MALPITIGLNSPYVAISASSSVAGITLPPKQTGVIFGTVEQIYAGCTRASVDSSVFFKSEGAYRIYVDNVYYFIVDDKNIFFYEEAGS